jgi:HAD superfamily hydrolase (TIGR01459 family)
VTRLHEAAGSTVPEISLDRLIERYDGFLFDAYGVLVHGDGIMPGARETIERVKRVGKPYFLISNDASKLPQSAAIRYRRFGLPVAADRILTSGLLLKPYFERHRLDGVRCAVLGTADSERYVQIAGGRLVPVEADFDVLVVGDETGYPFLPKVDAAMSSLFRQLDEGRSIQLVLPNPDLIYPSGEGFGLAAGSIALMFEAALARRYPQRSDLVFARLGKPEPHLYHEAIARIGSRNVVMIGDQVETDIAGANAAGIDSVLLVTGVSTSNLQGVPREHRPTWWIPTLKA